jgi:hypothetical protein
MEKIDFVWPGELAEAMVITGPQNVSIYVCIQQSLIG